MLLLASPHSGGFLPVGRQGGGLFFPHHGQTNRKEKRNTEKAHSMGFSGNAFYWAGA